MTNVSFTARDVPWMKVGHVIDHPVTAAEAVKLGGLDFNIELRDAGFKSRDKRNFKKVADRFAIVRSDTEEFFNFASGDYSPVQYAEAFDFINGISPEFVAAGQLKGGRKGFIVAKLPGHNLDDLVLDGQPDPHQLYVVLRTSMDLSWGIEIVVTTLRGKCMNQLTLPALTQGCKQRWTIRHTRNAAQRLEEAHKSLVRVDRYAEEFRSITARLADIDVDFDEAKRVLTQVLPDRPRRDEQIDAITTAWRDSETVGFTGKAWGLVNAVDEYFEWLRPARGRTAESRFLDGLDGAAHQYTGRAAQLLLN